MPKPAANHPWRRFNVTFSRATQDHIRDREVYDTLHFLDENNPLRLAGVPLCGGSVAWEHRPPLAPHESPTTRLTEGFHLLNACEEPDV
jgi:hypothetical protein